ncbi:MAG: LEA type 2 family protein [Myxococcaceae bacterium]
MRKLLLLSAVVVAFLGCKTAPETKPSAAPTLTSQEVAVDQSLTDFKLNFSGVMQSAEAARIEKADYELVVEGKVVKSGEAPLGVDVPAGGSAPFKLDASGRYVSSAEELKAMSEKSGSLLAALRGKLHVKTPSGMQVVEFARSKEVRVPRLPKVKMNEAEGARFSDEEVNIVFYLGVENPNPFTLQINGIQYTATVAGKQLGESKIGGGEHVSPSSTGVFEIPITFNKDTYGPDVKAKVKTNTLPYSLKGSLSGDLFEVPFELTGDLKLNVSK